MKFWKVMMWIFLFPFMIMWLMIKAMFWLVAGIVGLFFKEASKPSRRRRRGWRYY